MFNKLKERIFGDKAVALPNNASPFLGALFNPGEAGYGIMQPSDFDAQAKANIGLVYACVQAISESCAQADLKLILHKGEEVQEVKDHIFLDLISSVNPFMNAFELRELTEAYQLLTGNAYWYIVKNKIGMPQEIWIVPSQYMKIVPDKQEFIKGYLYQPPTGTEVAFTADEIIHFKYPNPNNVFYGISPTLAAAYQVDIQLYMNKFQQGVFKNSAIPDAILTTDQIINDKDAIALRARWQQLHGGVDKSGKIAILHRGLKYEKVQLTNQELSYIASKNVNRDEILSIFRVPKSILGLVEDVNRANAEASEYVFAKRNVSPKLKRFQEKLNEKLLPLYLQPSGAWLQVQAENVVPADKLSEAQQQEIRLRTGLTTINEERKNEGLEAVDWGDLPLMPISTAPLGTPALPPEEGAAGYRGQKRSASCCDPDATFKIEKLEDCIITNKDGSLSYLKMKIWAIWKARFDRETYSMRDQLIRFFRQQQKEVLDNVDLYIMKGIEIKDMIDSIIFDFQDAEKDLIDMTDEEIDAAYQAGIDHAKKLGRVDIAYSVDSQAAQEKLDKKKMKFSFQVNKTTENQLRAELNQALQAGENIHAIRDRVQKIFGFAELYRSMRIARTEIASAENEAIFDTWHRAGIPGKEWLHGGGGADPRPEHQEVLNGEVVAQEERFSNGLLYPGDTSTGQPGEFINCTCSLLPAKIGE